MQENEVVLSDVHLTTNNDNYGDLDYNSHHIKVAISRFIFESPLKDGSEDASADPTNEEPPRQLTFDSDGDIDVRRRPKWHSKDSISKKFVLTIEHSLAGPLPLVGMQVWNGALLLCDFILHQRQQLTNQTILELGSGTGLCSIVAAIFARQVLCTDSDRQVLEIAQRNVGRNRHLIHLYSSVLKEGFALDEQPVIRVKRLDWRQADPYSVHTDDNLLLSWTAEDSRDLQRAQVLLAADVIYDDSLTDSLFHLVAKILEGTTSRILFLTLEKRLNFTLDKLEVCCPAYDHFLNVLSNLETHLPVDVHQLPVDFPKYFDYERSHLLELWKISTRPQATTNH